MKDIQSLYKAILALESEKEAEKFFGDLLTEVEIREFSNRWKVARMLDEKVQYEIISKETGMSSTTIARISKWLNTGMGGYKLMVKRMNTMKYKNHQHTNLKAV